MKSRVSWQTRSTYFARRPPCSRILSELAASSGQIFGVFDIVYSIWMSSKSTSSPNTVPEVTRNKQVPPSCQVRLIGNGPLGIVAVPSRLAGAND
jgi:hypothetical protein